MNSLYVEKHLEDNMDALIEILTKQINGVKESLEGRMDRLENKGIFTKFSRVEMCGGLGAAYLFPPLSSGGASIASPCSVSTSRSSNRTCGFPASGSPTAVAFRHTYPLFQGHFT